MKHSFFKYIALSVTSFVLLAFMRTASAQTITPLDATQWRPGEVSIWKSDFTAREKFSAFPKTHRSGGNIISGDLDGDGEPEIIIGAGKGSEPYVRVFDLSGKLRTRFLAYEKKFHGGVRIAIGDVNNDGKPEIVTAPGSGREPMVRVFDADGHYTKPNGFLAYDARFQEGVHITIGDLNNDGVPEIITTPGAGGGPHVRVFDGGFQPVTSFFAFSANMRDGITATVIRTPSGNELVIGLESWSEPIVKRYRWQDGSLEFVKEFLAFPHDWKNGVTVNAVDIDNDGVDEIAVHGNGAGVPELRILSRDGYVMGKYMIHDPNYRGGLSITQIPGRKQIVSISKAPLIMGPLDTEKSIHVNISQQRLYAYEHGRVVKSFLISSGIYKYPTPIVESKVLAKIPIMDYRWSYGPNHPDNYFLPNVRWNLRFWPHFYLHTAYWHHNFGHRMSHGCVNISLANAKWLYDWAEVGTPVKTF